MVLALIQSLYFDIKFKIVSIVIIDLGRNQKLHMRHDEYVFSKCFWSSTRDSSFI